MIVNGVEFKKIWCHKCEHEWLSKLECPKKCPKCGRYDPWLPKGERNENTPHLKKTAKYPIQDLKVGESITLSWQVNGFGRPDVNKNNSMNRAIRQEEKRKDKKFERYPSAAGLRLVRIK